MATKAQLEQKIADLQVVLVAVQDEREILKEAVLAARGVNAGLERKLDLAGDELRSVEEELAAANVRIQELEGDSVDIEQLQADKARLLGIAGLTEVDFDLSNKSINAYLGKG